MSVLNARFPSLDPSIPARARQIPRQTASSLVGIVCVYMTASIEGYVSLGKVYRNVNPKNLAHHLRPGRSGRISPSQSSSRPGTRDGVTFGALPPRKSSRRTKNLSTWAPMNHASPTCGGVSKNVRLHSGAENLLFREQGVGGTGVSIPSKAR